jgi:hypothetical protein
MERMRQRLFPLLLGLLPVLVLADVFGAVVAGISLPAVTYGLAGTALALLAALAARPHGRRATIVGVATFALTGLLLAHWPYGELKELHRVASAVRVGMTRAEVTETLSPRLERSSLWPDFGPDFEAWYGDCSPGLRSCRVQYDTSGRVSRVETRFETSCSDFGRVAASRD